MVEWDFLFKCLKDTSLRELFPVMSGLFLLVFTLNRFYDIIKKIRGQKNKKT